jgi:hypothetical protein
VRGFEHCVQRQANHIKEAWPLMAQSPASCLSMSKEDRQLNNLFYLLKNSFVVGPSIIFNRYHEANKTDQDEINCVKQLLVMMQMHYTYGL